MKKPTISVIVPIYNAEKYLRECLKSIQNQTLKDIEIICVNDGSTDNSPKILKEFATKDKRFIIINQKNQGVNKARANGYKKATGTYIASVDSDDFLAPNAYEKMFNLATKNDSDIVICNYSFYPKKPAKKEVWYHPFTGKVDWQFISRNTLPWNKIIKKDFINKIKLSDLFLTMGENAFSIALISTNKISTIDTPLYNYRVGHASLSSKYNNITWFKQVVKDNLAKYNYSKEHSVNKNIQEYYLYTYLYYNLILMSVAAKNNDKKLYTDSKQILKNDHFFSKQFKKYFKHNVSYLKRIIFRTFIYPNFQIAKITTKTILR